jgi:hypothetical protein
VIGTVRYFFYVIVLAASFLAFPTSGAAAAGAACTYADPCGFSIATPDGGISPTSVPGGHAEAHGSIIFYTARGFEINNPVVVDKCNSLGTNDGLGAYLYANIQTMDGTVYTFVPHPTPMFDHDGCSNGSYYSSAGVVYSFPDSGPRIKCVRAFLAESDGQGSAFDAVESQCKDNPYT